MYIILLLLLLITVLIIIDVVKNSEYTNIAIFITVLLAFTFNYRYLVFLSLMIPVKSILQVFRFYKIAKMLGLYQVVKPFIPIAIYTISSLSIGYISRKAIIPLLDVWTSSTLFIMIMFLSLALTVQPSLDALSSMGAILGRSLHRLTRLLHTLSMALGVLATLYSIIVLRIYIVIPAILIGIMIMARRRVKMLKRLDNYLIILLFFISILLLSTIID
ncbi:MAG: hypothetical protein QW101_03940 [Ignisphaera sp.]|uniref:Uncharacterized protein n=1 Tax=Ignisphaera aggregans TaxID=334771 RepID=A0A7J3MXC3_9CREN